MHGGNSEGTGRAIVTRRAVLTSAARCRRALCSDHCQCSERRRRIGLSVGGANACQRCSSAAQCTW